MRKESLIDLCVFSVTLTLLRTTLSQQALRKYCVHEIVTFSLNKILLKSFLIEKVERKNSFFPFSERVKD